METQNIMLYLLIVGGAIGCFCILFIGSFIVYRINILKKGEKRPHNVIRFRVADSQHYLPLKASA